MDFCVWDCPSPGVMETLQDHESVVYGEEMVCAPVKWHEHKVQNGTLETEAVRSREPLHTVMQVCSGSKALVLGVLLCMLISICFVLEFFTFHIWFCFHYQVFKTSTRSFRPYSPVGEWMNYITCIHIKWELFWRGIICHGSVLKMKAFVIWELIWLNKSP